MFHPFRRRARHIRLYMFACATLIPALVFAQTLEQQLKSEGIPNLVLAVRRDGDARRGAIVFHQGWLACSRCHTSTPGDNSGRLEVSSNADGWRSAPLGPDLSRLGRETTAEHLIESVLFPSKVLRKGFEGITVEKKDGTIVTGLLAVNERDRVVLRNLVDGRMISISANEIESKELLKTSVMPDGQINLMASRQQFLDLLRYVVDIAENGPARATELQPPASLLVAKIPEYESQIDHRGILKDWTETAAAAESYRRGESIYQRLCINCHGSVEKPGSLPTSPRFAESKLKNGSDPYRMYLTLTHGFGLMPPQTWMVPQQKYDVIHYVRESFFRSHNRSQYTPIGADYLATLPAGNSRGPAPSKIEPWSNMDYGRYLIATYEVPAVNRSTGSQPNIAQKGIAIRLDSGPGGVSKGSHWMLFEHDTLRVAAAWRQPDPASESKFVLWDGINFNGKHQVHPRLVGKIDFANPVGPGWASPDGQFDDRRITGRDGRQYGPLPSSWGRYLGHYRHGDDIVISYRVGSTDILEQPGVLIAPSDKSVFTRNFDMGPRERDLSLLVATLPAEPGPGLSASIHPKIGGMKWVNRSSARILTIPAGKERLRFTIGLMASNEFANQVATGLPELPSEIAELIESPKDLFALTQGGPVRWPEVLETTATCGRVDSRSGNAAGSPLDSDEGPFAVDTLAPPFHNPWFAQMRLTGFDFLDPDRAAICTWDGDVWLVSGLAELQVQAGTSRLRWKRIASGLFQPLGLKMVAGKIYVGCRDQIVLLHDLNGDQEIDFYQCFNSDHQVTEHFHEFAMGLQVDEKGNFYYAKSARHALKAIVPQHGTLLRVDPDGSRTTILANGFRAANGVCLNSDGTFIVTDQEGHWNPKNRINWVVPPNSGQAPRFYGNMFGYHDVVDSSDTAMEQPLCWITNEFDRSPAELLWITSDRWGPGLFGRLLNLSYGYGKVYLVPHEKFGRTVQGGMIELPIPNFPTGVMRGRFSSSDGQLYLCGMFAWASSVTQPGGFYRLRATGRPVHLPVELSAKATGISLTFSDELDPNAASRPENYVVRTWQLKRSAEYGSKHLGEKLLRVAHAAVADDRRRILLEIPDIAPTWCMSIAYSIRSERGEPVKGLIHNTIHELNSSASEGTANPR